MKTVVAVNTSIPTIDNEIEYLSGESLADYDVILFDPEFPYLERVQFSAGGSCLTIESSRLLETAKSHWKREITIALKAGKTVFFIGTEYQEDLAAHGSTLGVRNTRTYQTFTINNYEVLPFKIEVRNAKGRQLKVVDNNFKGLYEVVKDIMEYRVVFTSDLARKILTTKDGSNVVGTIVKLKDITGNVVLLPHFNFYHSTLYDRTKEVWTNTGIQTSKRFVGQLLEIEKILNSEIGGTPKPDWMESISVPKEISDREAKISNCNKEIEAIIKRKEQEEAAIKGLLSYSALLYENGKALELAIEKSLTLIGYKVENFRKDDLEIDHIISRPGGIRMIGESEGKDNAAIDITKFRQLESNINEDFERPEVESPAKGVLFGNGYRLIEPSKRNEQFTQKCFINARRLGTALVRTSDLYKVALHILDNPKDEKFKSDCQKAIEETAGDIVDFPAPKSKLKKVTKTADSA